MTEVGNFSHEWHVAINKFSGSRDAAVEWPKFMYEAKSAASEVPRLTRLFAVARAGELPQTHRQCSHSPTEKTVPDNHLTCCLGVKCRNCAYLLALESAKLRVEQIDEAKAWTCVGHILMSGGDVAGEGFILAVDDRMFWDRLYANMAEEEPQP